MRPSQLRAAAEETAMMQRAVETLLRGYAMLDTPLTIIVGDGDRIVSARRAARLHEQVGSSRLVRLPDVGHMVHHSRTLSVALLLTCAGSVPVADCGG